MEITTDTTPTNSVPMTNGVTLAPESNGLADILKPATEAAPIETPAVTEEKKPDEEKNQFSFAELAKKEKQLRQIQKAAKEKERAFKEMEERFTSKIEEMQAKLESLTGVTEDPFKYLEHKNMSLADLNELAMNNGEPNEKQLIKQLQKKLEALESGQNEKLNQWEQRLEQEKKRENEEKLGAYKTEMRRFFDENKTEYSLAMSLDVVDPDMLTDAALAIHEKTGKVPSFKELGTYADSVAKEQFNSILEKEDIKNYVLQYYGYAEKTSPSQNNTRDTQVTTITNKSHQTSAPNGLLPRDESIRRLAAQVQAQIDAKMKE